MLVLGIGIAYAEPNIKLYGNATDYTQDYLYKYDLKGVKWILIYPDGYSNYWAGYYYPYQIRLYSSDEKVFVHELAHHYDYLETGNFQRHTENFYKKQWEIWESIKE